MIGIYPGSFDPITMGHIDTINRAAKFLDKLIIAVMYNINKKYLFDVNERILQFKEIVQHPNVEVIEYSGLLAELFVSVNADVVIRGLRNAFEYENEYNYAVANKQLNPNFETLFIPTSPNYQYLSSSLVKEIAMFSGDIAGMVPTEIEKSIKDKIALQKI